jgi:hypothetical protein
LVVSLPCSFCFVLFCFHFRFKFLGHVCLWLSPLRAWSIVGFPSLSIIELVHSNHPLRLGHCDSWRENAQNKSFWLLAGGFLLFIVLKS